MSAVIQVDNIGKLYRLGDIGTGTLSHDLNRFFAKIRGKEDPYLKLGVENDRSKKTDSDLVWALRNVNFSVQQGEVLGIIGRNGAGKSTLLKILSRTTTPTTGSFKAKGRIASLLEVGTGFHPELTGRENIFLNGAILGMTREEIKRKFDAMVDFSGVERYIDTPVKRYSSGMYVRLAFAVAAHLEPEILILDEVLAVGDAEFQKKCLGKIKDVSGEGRTVLFVSHNIGAVKSLCDKALILKNGQVLSHGETHKVVNQYLNSGLLNTGIVEWSSEEAPGNSKIRLKKIELINNGIVSSDVDISKETTLKIYYENFRKDQKYQVSVHLVDNNENYVFCSLNAPSYNAGTDKFYYKSYDEGVYVTELKIPGNFLNEINYHFNVIFSSDHFASNELFFSSAISFTTHDSGRMKDDFKTEVGGLIRPRLDWSTKHLG